MTEKELIRLIRQGENMYLEAKKAERNLPVSLWETYSSFCNTDGGVILLGVSEQADKRLFVTGVEDSDNMIRSFWNQINNRQKVSENLLFDHHVYSLTTDGDKEVIVIEIPRADRHNKPVYINNDLFGGTYRRNADGDYHCTREEVKAMLRDQSDISADSGMALQMTPDELDMDTIHRYRMRFANLKPYHAWNNLDDISFLLKAGALKRDRNTNEIHPTLAGVLVFGTESLITELFPDYFLDYREVANEENRWIDRVISASGDWSGNLFDFYFKVMDRLTSNVKVPFRLQNGLDRIDDTLVHQALREALANALIHADYYGRRGIVIEKKPNRLIVSNPGTLRITLSEALEGGISDPRNTLIFKMFILINIGERAGSGLHNLGYIWNLINLLPPQLKEEFSPGRLELEVPFTNSDGISIINNDEEQADQPIVEVTPPVTPPITPPVTPPVTPPTEEKLTNLEQRFLETLAKDSSLSRTQLAKRLDIGVDTVKEYLKKLKDKGYLERVGNQRKTGWWRIMNWKEE